MNVLFNVDILLTYYGLEVVDLGCVVDQDGGKGLYMMVYGASGGKKTVDVGVVVCIGRQLP